VRQPERADLHHLITGQHAMPRGVCWIPVHDDTRGLRRAIWAATNDDPGAAATAMVHALEEEAGS
jgi:hypothetical protein